MKILITYDGSAPKYHRLLMPCFLMPGIELVSTHEITDELCEGVDILYFNRIISNQSINNILALKEKHGFKIIADFDDHWELGPDHHLYDMYQLTQASDLMREWIKEADAVTVTHERLMNEVRPINHNVYVLPNAIPKYGQFMCAKQTSDVTRLFWAGGVTHVKDIELLRGSVKRFADMPVQMVMGGYSDKNPAYKRMASAYTNGGLINHELLEPLPVADYYFMYSKCDVALIPLTDTRFNSHKSNLKILEAANIGANVIVSNVHPYKDIPYVNYVDSAGDWRKWVNWILRNPDAAKDQAAKLQQYCDERFNFARINKTRYEILCTVANK